MSSFHGQLAFTSVNHLIFYRVSSVDKKINEKISEQGAKALLCYCHIFGLAVHFLFFAFAIQDLLVWLCYVKFDSLIFDGH